jgi:hypothetical protein
MHHHSGDSFISLCDNMDVAFLFSSPRRPHGNSALDFMAAGRAPVALEYEVAPAKLGSGRQIQMDCPRKEGQFL